MQLPSLEHCGLEGAGAIEIPKSLDPQSSSDTPPKRGNSRQIRREDSRARNRVMIVGRIRELALYRAEVLRHEGFRVSIPQSREEALDLIRNNGFDVAVLSYTLPSTLVQELADEVREHCPDCRIVTIAETARLDRRIVPDAVALAEEGPPALLSAIRKVMH